MVNKPENLSAWLTQIVSLHDMVIEEFYEGLHNFPA